MASNPCVCESSLMDQHWLKVDLGPNRVRIQSRGFPRISTSVVKTESAIRFEGFCFDDF